MDTPGIPSASAQVADFSQVVARLAGNVGPGEIERVGEFSVRVHERGAELAILRCGAELPGSFDVALLIGADGELDRAIEGLGLIEGDDTGVRRVQLLALPASPSVVDHALRAGMATAQQRRRAAMADKLLDVGAAMASERDPSKLLGRILAEARQMSGADAGSIYVIEVDKRTEPETRSLRFRCAENASLASSDFSEFSLPISGASVVGACVLAGEPITLDDLYSEDPAARSHGGRTFTHDRSFDERLGYQTRSMLTVPMRPPGGEVLGIIQLINARVDPHDRRPLKTRADFEQRVLPFDESSERLCRALAAQAAVALENARLYAEIEALFEGFVRASVSAIEQRDPTTSGHSERVATLTLGLAEVVDRAGDGALAEVRFDREAMREIQYAALLHDFGKVGVREDVLVKAKKLYPTQRARLMARFDHMRTAVRLHLLEQRLRGDGPRDEAEFEAALRAELARIDELEAIVEAANQPTILSADCSAGLRALEQQVFCDGSQREIALLEPEDIEALRIPRGTLTEAEREQIQRHAAYTYDFLSQIPWSRNLRRVPDIAAKHHRYLDGTGYASERVEAPRSISIQTRMMTIADIFDALTAADRPYKKAVPLERALDILEMEVEAGKLDRELYAAFVEGGVFNLVELARP